MTTIVLTVEGMACEHCVAAITTALTTVPGITKVQVELNAKTVTVDYEPEQCSAENIRLTIEDQGYEVVA